MAKILGKYGRAHAADMLRLLGVKKLPKEGMEEREIQGVRVYVKPSLSGGTRLTRRCNHRVFAICECGRHVPAGRLHQHICKGVTPEVMLREGRF